VLADKSLSCIQKVGQRFMLAIYELVRSLLANKWQIVRCDWLAVINVMAAE